jgi:hypothetical protein
MPTGGPDDPDKLSEAQSTKFMRVIDAETGNVVQIELIDTGLTTVDNIPIYTMGVGSSGGGFNVIIVHKSIGEITFTGSGLNDMINGGEYTGNQDVVYKVEIDGTGTPDTFKWYKNGTEQTPATINIDGTDQALDNGVTIKFNATTGHALGEFWEFTARAADPSAITKTPTNISMPSIAPGGSFTSAVFDVRDIQLAALTIALTFNGAATAGVAVRVFTSADGINFDVDPYASTGLEPTFVAGAFAQKTTNLDLPVRYIKIEVENLDGAQGTSGQPSFLTELEV